MLWLKNYTAYKERLYNLRYAFRYIKYTIYADIPSHKT